MTQCLFSHSSISSHVLIQWVFLFLSRCFLLVLAEEVTSVPALYSEYMWLVDSKSLWSVRSEYQNAKPIKVRRVHLSISACQGLHFCEGWPAAICKLQNEEKTVGFVFLAVRMWCFFFPRPNLKPWSRTLCPRGRSSPRWHATNLPLGSVRCGPTWPQTALYVSDVKHFLGHASTADCIYNKQRTKQMFVGCGGEKQTRQTVGWLHASLRLLCVTHFAGILLLEKLV